MNRLIELNEKANEVCEFAFAEAIKYGDAFLNESFPKHGSEMEEGVKYNFPVTALIIKGLEDNHPEILYNLDPLAFMTKVKAEIKARPNATLKDYVTPEMVEYAVMPTLETAAYFEALLGNLPIGALD